MRSISDCTRELLHHMRVHTYTHTHTYTLHRLADAEENIRMSRMIRPVPVDGSEVDPSLRG